MRHIWERLPGRATNSDARTTAAETFVLKALLSAATGPRHTWRQ